jgi:hypothetical protein
LDDQCREQRGSVSAVKAVKAASEAIVAEKGNLIWLDAEVFGDATSCPGEESVEGAASKQEVGDQDTESDGGGDVFGASGGGR